MEWFYNRLEWDYPNKPKNLKKKHFKKASHDPSLPLHLVRKHSKLFSGFYKNIKHTTPEFILNGPLEREFLNEWFIEWNFKLFDKKQNLWYCKLERNIPNEIDLYYLHIENEINLFDDITNPEFPIHLINKHDEGYRNIIKEMFDSDVIGGNLWVSTESKRISTSFTNFINNDGLFEPAPRDRYTIYNIIIKGPVNKKNSGLWFDLLYHLIPK